MNILKNAINSQFIITAYESIMGLANKWERRSKDPFYTLGAASYLDAQPWKPKLGIQYYIENAAEKNVFLIENFSYQYATLFKILKNNILNGKIALLHALPGFHIFKSCKEFQNPTMPSIHRDIQYQNLTWPGPIENTFSFTIPIKIPKSGAGLIYWERTGFSEESEFHINYNVGDIIYHFGLIKHQIAPFKEVVEKELRITMQGHGVLINGAWYLYW